MGGLEVDLSSSVIGTNGKAITGLHAASELAGGILGTNRSGGNSLLEWVTVLAEDMRVALTTLDQTYQIAPYLSPLSSWYATRDGREVRGTLPGSMQHDCRGAWQETIATPQAEVQNRHLYKRHYQAAGVYDPYTMFGIITVAVSLLLVRAVLGSFRQFYIEGTNFMNIKGAQGTW